LPDDGAIIFTGKYPPTLCDLMAIKLRKLVTWAKKVAWGITPTKMNWFFSPGNIKFQN